MAKVQTLQAKSLPITQAVADDRLRQIETKHDLLRFKVDGWCIWPFFRHDAGLSLQNLSMGASDGSPIKERFAIAAKDLLQLTHLPRARYLVKTYSSARAEQKDGLYKDIYFDDLLLDIGDYFKIESINNSHFIPRSRAALIKSNMTTIALGMATRRLAGMGCHHAISDIANHLSECLRQEKDLEGFTPKVIASRLLNFYRSKKFYGWLFKQIKPQYLLTADFGECDLVASAKEQGITVVEFQHGIINRHIYGYSWSPYALPYKAAMPVPDRLFLYGEYGREELAANGFWEEELRPVGSLRLERYRNLGTNQNKQDGICTILLTSQGIDVERVISLIYEFTKIASGQIKYHLFIKLHPSYETDKKSYLALFRENKNIQVLLGNEAPSTFELLTRAHLHVSISSTCHYEALALGIPTVILPFATHENVLHLYETGHAYLARTSEELLNLTLQWRSLKVPSEVGDRYFRRGALENMKRELELLPR